MATKAPTVGRADHRRLRADAASDSLSYLWIDLRRPNPAEAERATRSRSPSRGDHPRRADRRADHRGLVGKVEEHRPAARSPARPRDAGDRRRFAPLPRTPGHPARQDAARRDLRRGPPPGRRRAEARRGATLPVAQVAPTIKLDEILRTFDPEPPGPPSRRGCRSRPGIHGRGPRSPTRSAPTAHLRRASTRSSGPSTRNSPPSASCSPTERHPRRVPAVTRYDLRRPDLPAADGSSPTRAADRDLAAAFRAFPTFLTNQGDGRPPATFSPTTDPLDRAARPRRPSALAHPGRASAR